MVLFGGQRDKLGAYDVSSGAAYIMLVSFMNRLCYIKCVLPFAKLMHLQWLHCFPQLQLD